MARELSKRDSMADDIVWFFDRWNILGAIVIGIIIIASLASGGFNPQNALVLITAMYAFVTFNQMRESKFNPRPARPLAVRPYFRERDDRNGCDFGLKNFGEGPALNLRLKAVLLEGGKKVDSVTVSAKDRHFHLDEGGFLSLNEGTRNHQSLGDLNDAEDAIFENHEQKSIELYYTFESNDGTQYPLNWNSPAEMTMAEVENKSESPRTVELTEILEKCVIDGDCDHRTKGR